MVKGLGYVLPSLKYAGDDVIYILERIETRIHNIISITCRLILNLRIFLFFWRGKASLNREFATLHSKALIWNSSKVRKKKVKKEHSAQKDLLKADGVPTTQVMQILIVLDSSSRIYTIFGLFFVMILICNIFFHNEEGFRMLEDDYFLI